MPRLRKWPVERLARLVQLWNNPTLSLDAIAEDLGVTVGTVKRRADYLALRERHPM